VDIPNLVDDYPLDRDLLESMALQQVCACQYYDLTDCIGETSDEKLIDIINHNYYCSMCGLAVQKEDN